MIRKLKVLGLALVAIAAMSATVASAAQAGSFDVGAQPSVLTGQLETGQQLIDTLQATNGNQFNSICSTATFEGTVTGQGINEATVTPTYSGCKIFGLAAPIRMNGCKFTITGVAQPANTFLVDIVGCTVGFPYIQIQTAICQLRLPEQSGISHLVASNLQTAGQPHEITLSTTASGITVQQLGAGCPDGNLHHSKNFAFQSNMVLKAFKDLGSLQVTNHGHQYAQFTDGEQVGLTST
jgi:hypothetical protein